MLFWGNILFNLSCLLGLTIPLKNHIFFMWIKFKNTINSKIFHSWSENIFWHTTRDISCLFQTHEADKSIKLVYTGLRILCFLIGSTHEFTCTYNKHLLPAIRCTRLSEFAVVSWFLVLFSISWVDVLFHVCWHELCREQNLNWFLQQNW